MTSNKEYKTKNDENWDLIFNKYNILDEIEKRGDFLITSKQINEFRESRLMTKFDHKSNLPIIFEKNNLSILPLTRGSYMIAKFDAYKKIEYSKEIKTILVDKRYDLESLDYSNIYSESAALNCALASGIIEDVLGERCELTVNGRMSVKSFEFCVKEGTCEYGNKKVKVKNCQCEIDGGFEGENKFALIEAKNTKCSDFLIRQIYYPYRLWQNKISKEVVPIFMTYSNDKFSFFIYEFTDINNYNSLKLVEQKDYIIALEPINLGDLKELLDKIKLVKEPKVPFPQADNFERIMDLIGLLAQDDFSKEDITLNYDFDKRQTDYYFNAGRYLDLVEKYKDEDNLIRHRLTKKGIKIMNLKHRDKNLEIVKSILEHKIFNDVLKYYFEKLKAPNRREVVKIMKRNQLYNVNSEETYFRRSQSVLKWIEWILDLIE